jgi:hypothetical protein
MRPLTNREKRTVRFAAIGIGIYLVLFGGFALWKAIEKKRADYQQLAAEARNLRREIQAYENRAQVVQKMMEDFHLDPARLSQTSVVAQASAAIQKAAITGGLQLGPIRESPARPSARELASVQFEGTGPVPAVLSLLHRLERLGYPLIVDSVLITPEAARPGQAKLNLTIIILDFEQWRIEVKPNA